MPIDQQDLDLLERLSQAVAGLRPLPLSEATAPWQRSALALLESAYQELYTLVRQEDVEEAEALEAMQQVRRARKALDLVFADLIAALDMMRAERLLGHLQGDDQTQALAHFLARYRDGHFQSLRDAQAVSALKQGLEFLALVPASSMRQTLEDSALEAERALKLARMAAANEGAQAVDAFAQLVDGRSLARVCYLTARDLISAALRFEGRHEELDALLPLLDEARHVGVPL